MPCPKAPSLAKYATAVSCASRELGLIAGVLHVIRLVRRRWLTLPKRSRPLFPSSPGEHANGSSVYRKLAAVSQALCLSRSPWHRDLRELRHQACWGGIEGYPSASISFPSALMNALRLSRITSRLSIPFLSLIRFLSLPFVTRWQLPWPFLVPQWASCSAFATFCVFRSSSI